MAILKTELRIGNIVKDGDAVVTITELRTKTCDHSQAMLCPYEDLEPVDLSPEILVKAGFIKDNYDCYYLPLIEKNQNLWVKPYKAFEETHWSFCISFEFAKNTQPLPDKDYLHQLQNLYFSLTGEELKIDSL